MNSFKVKMLYVITNNLIYRNITTVAMHVLVVRYSVLSDLLMELIKINYINLNN